MNEINFQPLFIYLDEQFREVRQDIGEIKQNVNQLQTSVDGLAIITKNLQTEMVIVNRRLEVLEAKVL